ncbi:MAG: hypothetical protein O3A46_10685 [Candidatus Poribacteria bacterium]|nr:hypothetical protein [Candidatus Poribacteria bacterium]
MSRIVCSWFALLAISAFSSTSFAEKPPIRDFMGICGHTVQFKPELYAPICRLVRDYHPIGWDFGDETDYATDFPWARNRVNWETVYGSWKEYGFTVDASLMFHNLNPDDWVDLERDARAYGKAFATAFGPSGERPLVTSAEIGNEPGHYDDASYRRLFEAMASGLREGDSSLLVATCAVTVGESHRYAKSVEVFDGLESLYDALTIHVYAQVEGWPTWRRSYPEDPSIDYLQTVQATIDWRDAHVPDKPVWITEFGWDSSTQPAPFDGTFAKWVDVSDAQQAQYLVRSFLAFSKMDVDRAYIYFFNDEDAPHVHGSSGLTRHFEPKPSYHAVAHLYGTLGDYRFVRAVEERVGDLYVYEFESVASPDERVWAIWSPTGEGKSSRVRLNVAGARDLDVTKMPLSSAPSFADREMRGATMALTVDESPVYVRFNGVLRLE